TVAPELHLDPGAGALFADDPRQLGRIVDAAAIDLEHHVARLHAGFLGRAAGFDAGDQRTARIGQAEGLRQILVHALDGDAQPPALYAAVFDELVLDVHRHVDRDRERDAHEAARAR